MGMTCPMATAPVDFSDPAAPGAEAMYAGCAAAGVKRLKVGFWRFRDGDDYWQLVERARESLAKFVKFGERYHIQTCYQVHSGQCLGSNCAGLMHLIHGFDPSLIGAYPDFGHMALDGEDYGMGLAMVRDHLSIIGIKDALHAPQPGAEPPFVPCFVPVGKGVVNWRRALGALKRMGFDGPLTVHTEYTFNESIIRNVGYADASPPNLEEYARSDVIYLRRMWEAVSSTYSENP
jgi:sugar phosphate isomerase/epimerase